MTVSSRRPLVAGNWKLNASLELVRDMQQALQQSRLEKMDVVVCPPFPYLSLFEKNGFALGGQNLSQFESGAHTGEVSAQMLRELGCDYVIIGHSERRAEQGENDDMVAQKVQQALENGLTPILCVGESEQVRESGQVFEFIARQLDAVLTKIGAAGLAKIVIAYEPIWAIGTGNTATPEQAQEVHGFIRSHVAKVEKTAASALRILYGGSVKADNAALLFAQADVDGGLIGGASLKTDEFIAICQAANS
ncbi:triose-phosphate isomerase [Aliiglaciecola sp. CAU 1673]|uniref:triose-phosphate isomerase n=1 Tax=Aliiglaciecola sp. CAU 1673 TaxID=3032595 RepID=UPI0023DA2D3D|nr:triose-phosphate isomerase [Aliiglaciecola sp. CAU 1673]MDF2179417.1 triose-phosphate isomerase [Aliiglaciecola sp. CAU 1673]